MTLQHASANPNADGHNLRTARGGRVATVIGALGRFCIISGLLLLAFAGFQLWGTGLAEARAQDDLESEFEDRIAALRSQTTPTTVQPPASEPETTEAQAGSTTETPTETIVEPPLPAAADTLPALTPEQLPVAGDAIGRLTIPSIGVEKTFLEGISRDDLRSGPGHYPSTPLPGQPGNAAIAGHRTTNGAPFFDLDKLVPGDQILVETLQGNFVYEVEGHAVGGSERGYFIVAPSESHVLSDYGDNRLTLTACEPKYSAAQRIIVTAILVSEPAPASPVPVEGAFAELANEQIEQTTVTTAGATSTEPASETTAPTSAPATTAAPTPTTVTPTTVTPTSAESPQATTSAPAAESEDNAASDFEESLSWNTDYLTPTFAWAAFAALVATLGWLVGRRQNGRTKRLLFYAGTGLLFLPCLFVCFSNLDRLLPAV